MFIKPSKGLCPKPNELLQPLKSLYGLADSGDHWGRTVRFHPTQNLGIETVISNTPLYIKRIGRNLAGLCACYVDDTLLTESETYSGLTKKT